MHIVNEAALVEFDLPQRVKYAAHVTVSFVILYRGECSAEFPLGLTGVSGRGAPVK